MKNILIFIFVISSLVATQYEVTSNKIVYYGVHALHKWEGSTTKTTGTLSYDKNKKTYSCNITVPLNTFSSGNDNRDSNMLDVVEEYYYPFVRFTSSKINKIESGFNVVGNLSFHGITKEFTIPVELNEDNENIIVASDFSIMLTDFKIKRPALLTIKIRNQVDIKVYLVGSIENQK